jgi:Icc-related predicted phosphoesterase
VKFVAISDTHSRHHNIKLPKGDVLIHAGDISYRGKKEEMLDFLEWFRAQKFQHKIFIAGNHDFYLERIKPAELLQMIPEGITYLNDSGIKIGDINIWGSPVTPWFHNWAFNRRRGDAIRKHWELIPTDTNLLITHGPVFGFLDTVINEQHVGCQDLLRRVLVIKPKVHLCGHIHESYGAIKRSGIRFINACTLNEGYEPVNRPIVFEM